MWTKTFWKATAERVIGTSAQTLIAAGALGSVGVLEVDWVGALSLTGSAALLALLKCIAASTIGSGDGPGFTSAEELGGRGPAALVSE